MLPISGTSNMRMPSADDERRLDEADDDVGRDLAEHDLERLDRHGEQALHGAALHLARDGERGEDQHGHGEDGAEQARHDVEAGDAGGIVAAVLADLEGGRQRGRLGQAAVARERGGEDAFQRAERGAGGHGIGGVGDDQQRRAVAAPQVALEAGGNLDAEQHLAGPDPVVHLGLASGRAW